MEHNSSDLIKPLNKVDVSVTINSVYAREWGRYLEENGFDVISSNPSSVSARRLNTWLILGSHDVDVSIR